MKPLVATQSALSIRNPLAVVTLAKLTTYSNRLTGTIQTERYFSEGTRLFNWQAGGVKTFEPWLVSLNPMRSTMSHLPDAVGGSSEGALRSTRRVRLRNATLDTGIRLWNALRAENILFARVEIAELILDRGVRQDWHDLRAITGTDPTFFARGEIVRVGTVSDAEIELEIRSELPAIPWRIADQITTDPRDRGKRLPLVIGAAKHIEAIGWDVGAITALAVATVSSTLTVLALVGATTLTLTSVAAFPTSGTVNINDDIITYTGKSGSQLTGVSGVGTEHAIGRIVVLTTGDLQLSDASGFPSSGQVMLGAGEVATYTGKTANTLTGVSGLTRMHGIGDTVIEKQTTGAIFLLSQTPLSAVDALYVWAPFLEQPLRITTAYTLTLSNTTLIAGATVTTASFSAAQLQLLLDMMLDAVSQQPARSTDAIAPPSLMPLVDSDSPTSATLQAGSMSSGTAAGTMHPSAGIPVCNDGTRIQYVFTDYSTPLTDPPVELIQQTVTFLASQQFLGSTIEVKALNDGGGVLDSQIVSVSILSASGHALHEVLFADPTHITDVDHFELEMQGGSSGTVRLSDVRRQKVYRARPGITTQPQVSETGGTEVQVRSASVGVGLRIFTDAQGPVSPGSPYSATAGTVIAKGPDVIRYVLRELCGQPDSAIDATSWAEALTNLGTDVFAVDLRELGDDFEAVMLRLAAEIRANLIADERSTGAVYRLLTATAAYGFGASVRTVDDWLEFSEETRTAEDVQTRFTALYDFDPSLGSSGQVEAFRKTIAYVSATAEAKFGRREGGHLPFLAISSDTTAAEVAGYYAAERPRVAALWAIRGVPWRLGYDLERGDIIAFTPPWSGSAAKGRILETQKDPDSGLVDLRVVEVA